MLRSLSITLFVALLVACGGAQDQEPKPQPPAPDSTEPSSTSAEETTRGEQGEIDPDAIAGDSSGKEPIPKERVYFATDSHALDADAKAALDDQVTWMKENESRTVVIHGYASDPGSPTYNLSLANRRANAMRDYMVDKGIEIERISIVSHGEKGPDLDPALERRAVFATDR